MKSKLLIILTVFVAINCRGQETIESKFLDSDEVRFFIEKHPVLTYDDIVESDFPKIMYNAGISFVGISGLLIGYELDEAAFQNEFGKIENSYSYLFPLDTLNNEPLLSFCEADTIVPDVSTILKYSYFEIDSSSKMYLLENKLGIFVDKKFLKYPYECPNPSHGSSCGAVVDFVNRRILYWVIFW